MVILSGKELGSSVKANVASLCERFEKRFYRRPVLAVVLVGEDPASQTYVNNKKKACDEVGILHRDYVFDSFSVKPDGYLCKPFEYAAFAEVMDNILAERSLNEHKITLKQPRTEVVIQLSEIISVIACDHVAEVRLITGEVYESRVLFKEIEAAFENEPNFLLCNRGVIINMDYAVKAKEDKIIMQNGSEYPIRQRDKKEITARFTRYAAERMKRGAVL